MFISRALAQTTETAADAAGAAAAETTLIVTSHSISIWGLFLSADIVVKFVMLLLVAASLWSWTIIFEKIRALKRETRLADSFEDDFWSGGALTKLYDRLGDEPQGVMAAVFCAAMREWRRSGATNRKKMGQTHSLGSRIERSMSVTIAREIDSIEKGMGFLASVGSVAPFVGLFGTVWGIMNAFQSIAESKNTSLAVVAPGIAEALFATALGLAAAIPAVVAYNRFRGLIDTFVLRLETFSDEFNTILSRQFE